MTAYSRLAAQVASARPSRLLRTSSAANVSSRARHSAPVIQGNGGENPVSGPRIAHQGLLQRGLPTKVSFSFGTKAESAESWASARAREESGWLSHATMARHRLTSSMFSEPKHLDSVTRNALFPLPTSTKDTVLNQSSLAFASASSSSSFSNQPRFCPWEEEGLCARALRRVLRAPSGDRRST